MNLNFSAPINQVSYGITGLNLLKAAKRRGHEVALWPIGLVEAPPQDHALIQEAITRSHSYDLFAPSLRLWHQHGLAQHVGKGKRCGFPIFELDDFTGHEKHELHCMDLLFAASEWGCEVLRANGYKNVYKLPLGVDTEVFRPVPADKTRSKKTVFLTVGKFEVRKGHPELIEAFNKAFSPSDNVLLIMACANPFLPPEETTAWVSMAEDTPMGGHIKVLTDRAQGQESIANLMSIATCGVFPTRAEGFCLPILEMMAMGKHVITTDYSGHTEFVNAKGPSFTASNNALIVPIDEKETAYDGRWFHGTGKWARLGESQIDQLVAHMRDIHKRHQAGEVLFNEAGVRTAQHYSWDNSIAYLEEGLSC